MRDEMPKKKPSALKGMFDRLGEGGRDALFGTSENLPHVIEVDMGRLRPNPEQPRKSFGEGGLDELAASIAKHGLLQPITVMHDPEVERGFVVVAGERRYRAHQRLGRETIPAILTTGNPDELALIENIQREDLNPIEEAEALQRMIARYGYTQEELAKVIGKNHTTVSHTLKLNDLPEALKVEVATSQVPKSVLIEVSKLDTPEAQLELWGAVKRGNLTVREVRARKRRGETPPSRTKKLLASGRNFAGNLERLANDDVRLGNEEYEALVGIYRSISEQLDRIARKEA